MGAQHPGRVIDSRPASVPWWRTTVDIFAVLAFIGVMVMLGSRLVRGVDSFVHVALLPALALAGYVVADFASGVAHWLGDTFFEPRTPVLGPAFIRPFRAHHADQTDITRHGPLELNGNNALIAALGLAPLWWADGGGFGAWTLNTFAFFLAGAVMATNQFHQWAHQDSPARWVAWLQRRGLILSPERHAIHHTAPHDRSFCITTGWLNPLLDRIRLFNRVEAGIRRLQRTRRVDASRAP